MNKVVPDGSLYFCHHKCIFLYHMVQKALLWRQSVANKQTTQQTANYSNVSLPNPVIMFVFLPSVVYLIAE